MTSSRQPCLAVGLHGLFEIAAFGGKDALHRKAALFQAIGECRVFARIFFEKLAVDLDHPLREVEVAEVVDPLAPRDLPYALSLLDMIVETGMRAHTQIEARVLADDDRIGLGDGLVAVEGHHGRGDDVLGAHIRLAHPHRAIDEIAPPTLEPGYFDAAVRL